MRSRLESRFLAMTSRERTNGRAEDRRGKREGVDDRASPSPPTMRGPFGNEGVERALDLAKRLF